MPLPTPQGSETDQEFLDRCMGNPTMNNDFPDNAQRYAVCQSQLDKEKIMQAIKEFQKTLPNH